MVRESAAVVGAGFPGSATAQRPAACDVCETAAPTDLVLDMNQSR
jgi:hypothetical protein